MERVTYMINFLIHYKTVTEIKMSLQKDYIQLVYPEESYGSKYI